MNLLVVDASVAAKWFFQEAHSRDAACVLNDRNELHAPDLLLMEMDSVIGKRVRRKQITVAEGRKIRGALRRFPIQTHASPPLLDAAFELSIQADRSVYDCVYLALALLLKGRMITADRRLFDGLTRGPLAESVVWVGEAASLVAG